MVNAAADDDDDDFLKEGDDVSWTEIIHNIYYIWRIRALTIFYIHLI